MNTENTKLCSWYIRRPSLSLLLPLILAVIWLLSPSAVRATDGTWINTASGGLWSDSVNWNGGVVANGSGSTADFSTIDIGVNNTVLFDEPHTLSSLIFGDTASTYYNWTLSNNGNSANVLTLDGASSITIARGNLTNNVTIAGTSGLVITNIATASYLVFDAANTFTGDVSVNAGTVGHLYLLANNAGALGGSPSAPNSVILAASSAARSQLFLNASGVSYPAYNQLVMRPLGSAAASRSELRGKNGSTTWNGGIVLDGASGSSAVLCDIYADSTTGTLTLNGNITLTNNFTGLFNLRGGNSTSSTGVVSGVINIGSVTLGKNDPCTWIINSSGNTWGSMNHQSSAIILGANNALPATAPIAMSGSTVINLKGFSQILSTNVTGGTGRQITSSLPGSVLTFSNLADVSCAVNITGGISLVKKGPATLSLTTANSYTGDTVISEGTLGGAGTITGSTNIIIAAGATFAPTSLSLSAGQNLKPVDQTSLIAGTVNMASGTLVLNYTVGTPSLTVSNGNLVMSASGPVIINVTGSVAVGNMYKLVAATDAGLVSGTMPVAVTLNGAGGQAGSLVVSNSELYLVPSSAPFISTQLPSTNNIILFAGANPSFSVAVGGVAPLTHQWFTNGVANGAAAGSGMVWSNVQVGSISAYCLVTNSYGSATSAVWSASVIAAPTNPYPATVLADRPLGYWRLNEPDNGLGNYNAGVIAHDYMSGNNGIYTNTSLGLPGYSPSTDPNETSALFVPASLNNGVAYGISGFDFASPASTSKTFTIEAWVNAYEPISDAGIVTKGYGSGGEQFNLDTGGSGYGFRFLVRNASGAASVASSSIVPAYGTWHHLVGVCDEPNARVSLYVDGQLAASASISTNGGILASTSPMSIGARYSTAAAMAANNYDSQYFGHINDVAVYNTALSSNQVQAHYFAAGVAPIITLQPVASTNMPQNGPLTVSVGVNGSQPLAFSWYDVNANSYIPGQTNATLALSSVPSDNSYYLTVTNVYGTTNSSTVYVSVISGFTASMTPTTNLTLYAGRPMPYTVNAMGTWPIYYRWYTNGVCFLISTNRVGTFPVALGSNSVSCVVSNEFGVSEFGPMGLTGVTAPTNLYQVTILSNNPVAYWPLNEADNGLNNGNPGVVAYDYVGGHNGTYANANLGLAGFNTTMYPALTAPLFGVYATSNSLVNEIDNSAGGLPNINFAQPSGNNAVLSVEAWVNLTNTIQEAAIVAKGNGHSEQFVLDVYNGRFRFFIREAAGTAHDSGTSGTATVGQWYHLVGVWDGPNGAARLYVNGVNATSGTGYATGIGLLTPVVNANLPGGSLVTIGSRSASTTATDYDVQFPGKIADVAIYSYVLSTNQIAADYFSGTNLPAPPTPGILNITNTSGGQMQLIWNFSGTLQSATNVAGPYNAETGAVSPYTVPATNAQMFYRVKQQ